MLDTGSLVALVAIGTLYGLWRFARSVHRAPMPQPRPTGPVPTGYGTEDKTFGDARMADYALPQDGELMGEVLPADSRGVFFGRGMGEYDADWVPHGSLALHYRGPRHMLTVAPTRSGKGVCAIIPNLLTLDRSIICIDPKGQNAAVTAAYRRGMSRTFLLNPFNEHGLGTARFNPLAHLSINDPNVFADVASLAEALIITEGKDPHWPDSARNLVSAIILHLIATEGPRATLPRMRSILGLPDEALILKIGEMAKSRYAFIAELAGQFLATTNEIKNVVSTARTQTKFLLDPVLADPRTGVLTGDDFRIKDFKDRLSTLYVILPSRHIAAYTRLLRLITVSAIDQLTARTGGVPVLMMLDEFKMLGHLSSVETAFSLAAGYNLQLWPFVQHLNQLCEVYGPKAHYDFIAGCGMVQVFAPNDEFTAEFFSKRIGDFTEFVRSESENTSHNISRNNGTSSGAGMQGSSTNSGRSESGGTSFNVSWSKTGLRLVTPSTLMALPADKSYLFLNGLKYPILAFRRPYWRIPEIAGLATPDPFHPTTALP